MKLISHTLVFCFYLVVSSTASANDELYAYLLDNAILNGSWEAQRVDYGIHYSSPEKMTNPRGEEISAVTLDFEGPQSVPHGVEIQSVMRSNIDNILATTSINSEYQTDYSVQNDRGETIKGLGATMLDVNGQKVGLIEYEVPATNLIFVRHGLILNEGRLYTLTMIFFDPESSREQEMALEMLLIAAVNSKKL